MITIENLHVDYETEEGPAHAVCGLVKLGGIEDRPAPFLSGGRQQRPVLARALVD